MFVCRMHSWMVQASHLSSCCTIFISSSTQYTLSSIIRFTLIVCCALLRLFVKKYFTCLIRSHMPLGRFIHIFPISFFLFLNFSPSVFCSPLHSLNRTHKDTAITIICYVNGFWFLLGSHREIWFVCVFVFSFVWYTSSTYSHLFLLLLSMLLALLHSASSLYRFCYGLPLSPRYFWHSSFLFRYL